MKNKITQTLIGLACSVMLIIGLAFTYDVNAATIEMDILKISDAKFCDIQLGDKAIDIKSDYKELAADLKIIADIKVIADNAIDVADKSIDDINIIDDDVTLVRFKTQKDEGDLLPLLNTAISKVVKLGEVDAKECKLQEKVLRDDILKA